MATEYMVARNKARDQVTVVWQTGEHEGCRVYRELATYLFVAFVDSARTSDIEKFFELLPHRDPVDVAHSYIRDCEQFTHDAWHALNQILASAGDEDGDYDGCL
jgi:hypothetical protein